MSWSSLSACCNFY